MFTLLYWLYFNLMNASSTDKGNVGVNYCFKVQEHGCQWVLLPMWKWTVNEQRAGMWPAETSWCLSQLQEGPRCATTCPCTSVCSPSSSQWHPRLRSSPLPPRLSCTWLAWKKCGPSLASLLPGTLMSQVWLLMDCGRFPLKVLTWKAGWALRFIPWPVIQD